MYLLSTNFPSPILSLTLPAITAPVGARCRSSLHAEWSASQCCAEVTLRSKSPLGKQQWSPL